MTSDSHAADTTHQAMHGPARGLWGACVSLAFWLSLLTGASCFAAVALAPKLLQAQRLAALYAENQHRLSALEQQTLQLARVVQALQQDPTFVEELARVEFDAFRPGEEVLPVEPDLRLNQKPVVTMPRREWASGEHPWLRRLATDQTLRNRLLVTAALLVVAAFTWLQDIPPRQVPSPAALRSSTLWSQLCARYLRPSPLENRNEGNEQAS